MKIHESQLVETQTGEIFFVTQLRGNKVVVKNIRSGEHKTWFITVVKPLFIQLEDKVKIKIYKGTTMNYILDSVFYSSEAKDYSFLFYNRHNERAILTLTELVNQIIRF